MADTSGLRGKSEFLKRLSAGKAVCSEVNKASSNTKFLHMRRHKAFVAQLESAQQGMVAENDRAQKDMRKQLDVYKRRKRSIFRERVMSQQESGEGEDPGLSISRRSDRSTTSLSSRGGGRKSSCYSVNLAPPTGSSSMSGMFPAILRVPIMASDDENIHTAIQRQLQQHMHRQESMHAQILRSRVHEFCHDVGGVQGGGDGGDGGDGDGDGHSFYITSHKRRIAFRETVKSAKETPAVPTLQSPASKNTALVSVA